MILQRILKGIVFKSAELFYDLYQKYGKRLLNRIEQSDDEKRLSAIPFKGVGLRLNRSVKITVPHQLVVGSNISIDAGAFLETEGGISIGDNACIGQNVSIYTLGLNYEGDRLPYDKKLLTRPVFIGRNVIVEDAARILPGCIIGEGAVVCLGAVVTTDVPPLAKVSGNPAKVIGRREEAHYFALLKRDNDPIEERQIIETKAKSVIDLGNDPFFIVGTGRCGTKFLADQMTGGRLICRHEPNSNLISWITSYAHGEIDADLLKQRIQSLFTELSSLPSSCELYGEADQKYSFCIPILKELFPQAKFIWLKREPKAFIASVLPRGWYDDFEMGYSENRGRHHKPHGNSVHAANRIRGDKTGQLSLSEWRSMSEFERSCWYYIYTNQQIEEKLSKFPKEDIFRLATNDLNNPEAILEVKKFVGLVEEVSDKTGKGRNRSLYPQYNEGQWTIEDRKSFARWFEESGR